MAEDYITLDGGNPDALGTIERSLNGNPQAMSFAWATLNFAHAIDDLVDSNGVTEEVKEAIGKAIHDYTFDLLLNPFVQRNNTYIMALLASMLARWLDGDKIKDPKLSAAVRCGDVDFIIGLAHLVGGWEQMRKAGKERSYDV